MKLSELLQGVEIIRSSADPDMEISGVSYDSRQTQAGDLFVAVTGYETDGHRFIPAAVQKGAVCVLCEKPPADGAAFVQTGSTRQALAAVSANWFGRPADKMTMLGVTGTNGKTTITYLLKTVLEKTLGAKVGLIGTIQNMSTYREKMQTFRYGVLPFAAILIVICGLLMLERHFSGIIIMLYYAIFQK